MLPRFFVMSPILTEALALVAGVLTAACMSTNESQAARGPDALGDASGPTQACTLVGCADGLTVALESGSEWPDGNYRFEIQADDLHVLCRASLPQPPCTDSKGIPPISGVTCDPLGAVQIVESGCALPRGTPPSASVPSPVASLVTHAFPAMVFDPKLRPQRVEIAVSSKGRLVGHTAFAPRFEKVRPNGAACPPTCHVARSALTLDF